MNHWLKALRQSLSLGLFTAVTAITPLGQLWPAAPAWGAERIYISYGLFERSVSVKALETYAATGEITDELSAYAAYVPPQRLEQFRAALVTPIPLQPVTISQFLYSPIAEPLLERLGQVIQSESRQPGSYGIRSSLILAAAEPEGLTLLNVLRQFPTRGIRIDVGESLEIVGAIQRVIEQTTKASAAIVAQASQEAIAQPEVEVPQLPDLWERGPYRWRKVTITLTDRRIRTFGLLRQERTFPADVYLPQLRSGDSAPPTIVISHGLGLDRTTFVYLAEHLASHGFAVAVPEHPGSSADQLRALLRGRASEVAEPTEFIDRPLDVSFLLDELERLTRTDATFRGQLNPQQAGVIGQSFGGYTALVLAGAAINLPKLRQECSLEDNLLNLSIVLQCRVLDVLAADRSLSDSRVKATIALNPIASTIFGEMGLSQLQTPVLMLSGESDTVAPALPEQIRPFTWITTPNKYLVLLGKGTHFSTITEPTGDTGVIPLPAPVVGPDPGLARRYVNALSLAFFQTYLASRPEYRAYLSASYAQQISQSPLSLSLIQSLSPAQLNQALEAPVPSPTPSPSPTPMPTPPTP